MIPSAQDLAACSTADLGVLASRLIAERNKRRERQPKPTGLETMSVGASRLIACDDVRILYHLKQRARRILGDPTANWTSRLTNHGRRVTRVR